MLRRTRSDWTLLHAKRNHHRPRRRQAKPFGRALRIEPLEDRRLLAVYTVTNLDDLPVAAPGDAPGTLRQAIFDANDTPGTPDTIEFQSGLSGTLFLYEDELAITDSLTITGPGAADLTIDASPSVPTHFNGSRIFYITDSNSGNLLDVEITGLTLTGAGEFGQGGAIFNEENLSIADCVISGNSAGNGGGIYSGGLDSFGGMLEVTNCTIAGNSADAFGGGIDIRRDNSLIVTDSTITSNTASNSGAGIHNLEAAVEITNSSISGNGSVSEGGWGLYMLGGTLTVHDSQFNNNFGGGLATREGDAFIYDSLIQSNTQGGGFADGGGGIFNDNNNLTISGTTISGNSTEGNGGGIFHFGYGDLTIVESTISGNTAGAGGRGGALYAFGSHFSIASSTLSGNSAGYAGGAIYQVTYGYYDTPTRITNTTISGNTAGVQGGGMWVQPLGTNLVTIAHSTITDNTANTDLEVFGEGGGIYVSPSIDGTLELDHTIVAGNTNDFTGDDDLAGEAELTYTLLGVDTGAAITDNGGNQIGTSGSPIDPLLGPLADNGGPTLTHRLLLGSPAIDTGDPTAVAGVGDVPLYDQRGTPYSRVFDGDADSVDVIDIGAYESDHVYLIVDTLDDNDDANYSTGEFSLREAIFEAQNVAAGTPTIVFDPTIHGGSIVLTLGELGITSRVTIEGPGAGLMMVDASGNDFQPGLGDGFGSRVFNIDNYAGGSPLDVTISGLTLTGADYANDGGAIRNQERLTLKDSVVTGNAAQWGGGIYNFYYGELTLINSTVSGNTGTSSGGGVYNFGGHAVIQDSQITGNYAPDAAGIRNVNGGELMLSNSQVTLNIADNTGGGILNNGDEVTVEDSTISGNEANLGAGVYNESGLLTVTRSTISGNMAGSAGGGIFNNFATVQVTDSTINGNSGSYGGGLYLAGDIASVTTITNSTISGNTATLAGGGLYNFQGSAIIAHSTISDNEAPTDAGGGIASWADSFTASTSVYSTIVAGNVGSDLLSGVGLTNSFVSNGYNLIGTGDGSSAFVAAGDQTGVTDPMLGPLADNGGPTWTHELLTGSPAIDMGDPSAEAGVGDVPEFDQRGAPFARIGGSTVDIGAFEVQGAPVLLGDYNENDVVDAADYTTWRDALTAGSTTLPNDPTPGTVDESDFLYWRSHFGETLSMGAGAAATQATAVAVPPSVFHPVAPIAPPVRNAAMQVPEPIVAVSEPVQLETTRLPPVVELPSSPLRTRSSASPRFARQPAPAKSTRLDLLLIDRLFERPDTGRHDGSASVSREDDPLAAPQTDCSPSALDIAFARLGEPGGSGV